jgi:hypothetical protein
MGGMNRVMGFGFYIQNNDKLSKKNRDILLTMSENYMGVIDHEMLHNDMVPPHRKNGELDSSLTDLEIVGDWNNFFQQHGHRFPEFEKEWLPKLLGPKQEAPKKENNFKLNKNNSAVKQKALKTMANPVLAELMKNI